MTLITEIHSLNSRKKQLIVVGAENPTMLSSLGAYIAGNLAIIQPQPIIYFNLSQLRLVNKTILARYLDLDVATRDRNNRISINMIPARSKIIIVDISNHDRTDIVDTVKYIYDDLGSKCSTDSNREGGINSIIIDSLQCLDNPSLGDVAETFSNLAKELNLITIGLSMMNNCQRQERNPDNKTPSMFDIQDSEELEQIVDLAILIDKHSLPYRRRGTFQGNACVVKDRHGARRSLSFSYNLSTDTFIR